MLLANNTAPQLLEVHDKNVEELLLDKRHLLEVGVY